MILSGEDAGRYVNDAKGYSIFTVDPGETNGWAWAVVGRKEIESVGITEALVAAMRKEGSGLSRFQWGQMAVQEPDDPKSETECATQLWNRLEALSEMGSSLSRGAVPHVTDLVIEDFILRARTMDRSLLSPVRMTSKLEQMAHCSPLWMRYTMHSSSDSKSVITDDRLKRWNLWVPGQKHARDAIRLLVLRLRHLTS